MIKLLFITVFVLFSNCYYTYTINKYCVKNRESALGVIKETYALDTVFISKETDTTWVIRGGK